MVSNPKYVKTTVTVNSATERQSTNGYYTGEQEGSVLQDYSVAGVEQAHATEMGVVHVGALLQDATNGSMPEVGVSVTHILTDCTVDTGDDIFEKNGAVTFTYTAATGKALPDTVTVEIGGTTAVSGTDYTWTKAAGTLAFADSKLSDDTEITVTAE